MDPETRAKVESLCLEALSKDARERAAFLDEACSGDQELRREVESLLAGRVEAEALLQTPSSLASAPPLTPGTCLGPYQIESFIGAGGMGQVYKAHDTRLGRTVAIKVLPPDLAAGPGRPDDAIHPAADVVTHNDESPKRRSTRTRPLSPTAAPSLKNGSPVSRHPRG